MKTFIIKCFLTLLCIFCVCGVNLAGNFTTPGFGAECNEDSPENVTDTNDDNTTETGTLSAHDLDTLRNLTAPKFFSPCDTPNEEPGICVEIRKCPVLYSQLANIEARQFIRNSRCEVTDADQKNPKVCCGKLSNYKNFTKNEMDLNDKNIFPKVCGNQKIILRGRIIGGRNASLGEFPWMARLIHKNKRGYKSYGCSGFLIHSKYVATAAHCVHHNFTEIRGEVYSVTLGEHDTDTEIDCSPKGTYCADRLQISRVAQVIVHPEYDPTSDGHYNDIALLHLNKGARITDYVKPICLQTDPNAKPYKYTISGWGKTEQEAQSRIKLKVDLKYFDHEECKDKYTMLQIALKDTQLCAGGEKNKDSCSGDSGGPLMMPNASLWYAAGIVSYGVGCGFEGWPGVYTNLPYYIPWIKTQILRYSLVGSKSNKDKKHKNKNKHQHVKNSTETTTTTIATTTDTTRNTTGPSQR